MTRWRWSGSGSSPSRTTGSCASTTRAGSRAELGARGQTAMSTRGTTREVRGRQCLRRGVRRAAARERTRLRAAKWKSASWTRARTRAAPLGAAQRGLHEGLLRSQTCTFPCRAAGHPGSGTPRRRHGRSHTFRSPTVLPAILERPLVDIAVRRRVRSLAVQLVVLALPDEDRANRTC